MNLQEKLPFIFLAFIGSFVLLYNSLFTVQQGMQAIVLQFGESRHVHTTPGLKFKVPFIQEVIMLDRRVLGYDLPPIHVTTGDQKRLVVDTYARYRIEDPLIFFKTVKPVHETGARIRLEALISSSVRNVLGKAPLRNMLSDGRSKIMREIEETVKAMAKPIGLKIVDVRIIRSELPVENRSAVFARMNAELQRFAIENRAKGAEKAQEIKSKADREYTVILAESQSKANEIRGHGDAEAIKIINEAIGKNEECYSFFKSMETYKNSFDSKTSVILSTESSLMRGLLDHTKN